MVYSTTTGAKALACHDCMTNPPERCPLCENDEADPANHEAAEEAAADLGEHSKQTYARVEADYGSKL